MESLEQLREQAKQIKSALDSILDELVPDPTLGAVNWADLMCVEVEISLTTQEVEWTATIEEASPSAREFAILVSDKLVQRGFPNIHIRTDW